MKVARIIAGVAAAALLLVLVVGWAARFRVARHVVDARLAAAGVPARYRITRLGPFHERLEQVSIGDPAAPDLVGRRIDVAIGYGLAGPVVREVAVDGVVLRARLGTRGLDLGALDRLLPRTGGGGAALPDLVVRVRDTALLLATPNGAVRADVAGAGNLRDGFRARARVAAPHLRLGGCRVAGTTADVALAVDAGAPSGRGPMRIAGLACPRLPLVLGAGVADLALRSDARFDRVAFALAPRGFAGEGPGVRFADLGGRAVAEGRLGRLRGTLHLSAGRVALPAVAAGLARVGPALAGTPIAATGARAAAALAALAARSAAALDLDVGVRGTDATLALRRLRLAGADGGALTLRPRGGVTWASGALRLDGQVSTGGGALPAAGLTLAQPSPDAPLTIAGGIARYAAGGDALAIEGLRASRDARATRIAATILADGPLAGGRVTGLALPIAAVLRADGALAINPGCTAARFDRLDLAGFRFDPGRVTACGAPLVARAAGGPLRLAATLRPARLTARTRTGTPMALRIAGGGVAGAAFTVRGVDVRIGPVERRTRLAAAAIAGVAGRPLAGRFAGLGGQVGGVPLVMDGGAGAWSLDGGRLAITGALIVRDAAASPRFRPLAARTATLTLAGARIDAALDLREPATGARVATATIAHDLATGAGRARLAVPALTFAPKGLQPDMVTPLTLGVVANVAGTVTGQGDIAWGGADGVRSTGRFATDRLDLAAAFGPVTGIATRLDFTDLLGLVTAPHQRATIAEINPGVPIRDGVVDYALVGGDRVRVDGARWPFAGGALTLDPAAIDLSADATRRLTFRVHGLDAAAFVQQLAFPNVAATGTFDGVLPMAFDRDGGRVEAGRLAARPPGGTLAYVGELSTATLGTMGHLAFDALKAIRYSALDIALDGRLAGEMVSRVVFTGVRQATARRGLAARLIAGLPFRFNIAIRAPFRGLIGAARGYADPRLLIEQAAPAAPAVRPPAVQSPASAPAR